MRGRESTHLHMENKDNTRRSWRRTALGRLKFELAGLAFARKHGLTPEEYADHLWSEGAVKWMGKEAPMAAEYLEKEAEAFRTLCPEVTFDVLKAGSEYAELVFKSGCLGGWGKNQWAIAKSLGLGKGHVCRYCRQAFRIWAKQLGLEACPEPKLGNVCVLQARKPEKNPP
ncbi:MAG: hypothetical protein HYX80_03405 [Chloroflexi bacterium]|nr:hypothetical protein [Chloroflexota bacterium]